MCTFFILKRNAKRGSHVACKPSLGFLLRAESIRILDILLHTGTSFVRGNHERSRILEESSGTNTHPRITHQFQQKHVSLEISTIYLRIGIFDL